MYLSVFSRYSHSLLSYLHYESVLCCMHTYPGLKEDKQTKDLLKIHWSNAWEEQDPGQKHMDLFSRLECYRL